MEYIVTDIEHKIANCEKIRIANKYWKEIVNYNYELTRGDINHLLSDYGTLKPNNQLDAEEREDIYKFFDEFDYSDIHTRQAVFQPKYKEDSTKAACISCVQILIRNSMVELHVYVRSQNIETNFMYDNQTYALIIKHIASKLELEFFKVFVKVASLHKLC